MLRRRLSVDTSARAVELASRALVGARAVGADLAGGTNLVAAAAMRGIAALVDARPGAGRGRRAAGELADASLALGVAARAGGAHAAASAAVLRVCRQVDTRGSAGRKRLGAGEIADTVQANATAVWGRAAGRAAAAAIVRVTGRAGADRAARDLVGSASRGVVAGVGRAFAGDAHVAGPDAQVA